MCADYKIIAYCISDGMTMPYGYNADSVAFDDCSDTILEPFGDKADKALEIIFRFTTNMFGKQLTAHRCKLSGEADKMAYIC